MHLTTKKTIAKMTNLERLFAFCILLLITCSKHHLIISSCLASSDIPADKIIEQKLDQVLKLPGQNFNLSFAHYSGYITVNASAGKAFFYWFVESAEDPSSKPLALWLNGGPACSSIAFGEAEEIGPFRPTADGKSVYLNPYAWNQVANIIFVESPAGTGFSYSNTSSDLYNTGDRSTGKDNLAFILGWLERFPQYKGRDFYLLGESYGGHFVPQLSTLIIRHNKAAAKKINFKGILIGNVLIDDYHDQLGIFDFLWTVGLISDTALKLLKENCAHEPYLNASSECGNAHNFAANEIGRIDYYSVYTPKCTSSSSTTSNLLSKRWPTLLRSQGYDPCTEAHSIIYFNLPEVQQALHVRGSPVKWETCGLTVHYAWKDSARSLLNTIKELTTSGIRIWIYSGNTDAVIPITSTRYSLRALNLPTVGSYLPWYEDGQVGGWTQQYEGLTFVAVNAAGHEVPLHKPKQALTIFKAFLAGTPLATSKQFSDH
ncbi:unnamed protein product [Coffea canephora]|uniref:Carboxypeptidase n=1 Tax=Coffea canephora TaxID=49390 RepID=A0A068UTR5_COFCA|nr:unnamed protein product [Coffea canephora]